MAYKVQGSRNEYVFDDTFDDAVNEINKAESQEEGDDVVYKDEIADEDVTAKNVEDIIQANRDRIEKKIDLSKKEKINKDLKDLQTAVNEAYSETYSNTRPYVFYGISKSGKEGGEAIDHWIQPESFREFKEKTGFRCLKIKQTQFHLLFWKYQPVYRFVITHLKDDEELIKNIQENGFADWRLKIAKEY